MGARTRRVALTIATVLAAAFVQGALLPWVHDTPILFFYPAVVVASLFGSGLLAALLSAALLHFVFERGVFALYPDWPGHLVQTLLFAANALIIVGVTGALRNARGRAERASESQARAREAAERAVASLEEERELRERFVATLSHDLRNPLAAARVSAQLLARQPVRGEVRERLQSSVVESLDRAERMIQGLLDASRLRAGQKLPLRLGECDLRSLSESVLRDLSIVHGERFRLEAPSALPGHWSADGLRRVLENLLDNAIKYGDPGSRITLRLEEDGAGVRIRVHNFGKSIPERDLGHLFDAFERSSTAVQAGARGWGLGLALVRGIAEAHGGSVAVESCPVRGTAFTVELPRDARAPREEILPRRAAGI